MIPEKILDRLFMFFALWVGIPTALFILAFPYIIYVKVTEPTFSLSKQEWSCTKEEQKRVGKYWQVQCIEYIRDEVKNGN